MVMKIRHFLLLSICFMGLNLIVNGQKYAIDKGASTISGSASFSTAGGDLYEYGGDRLTTITLQPSYNYFVAKNFYIGGVLDISYLAQGGDNMSTFGIGPQLGYAIGDSSSKAIPYFNLGIMYESITYGSGDSDSEASNGSNLFLGFGVLVPVKKNLAITVEGKYSMMKIESYSGNVITLGIGIVGLLF
jgi:hypothetical protein